MIYVHTHVRNSSSYNLWRNLTTNFTHHTKSLTMRTPVTDFPAHSSWSIWPAPFANPVLLFSPLWPSRSSAASLSLCSVWPRRPVSGVCRPQSCQVLEAPPRNSSAISKKFSPLSHQQIWAGTPALLCDDAKGLCDFEEMTLVPALFYSSVKVR